VQKTIREELSGALVITIAHRLSTILDYDRVLVLGDGQMVEFAEPRTLLQMPNGRFKEMCRRSADWPILSAKLGL
jgi:ABC-type multidrug transport system fused ATPase/permease subunit